MKNFSVLLICFLIVFPSYAMVLDFNSAAEASVSDIMKNYKGLKEVAPEYIVGHKFLYGIKTPKNLLIALKYFLAGAEKADLFSLVALNEIYEYYTVPIKDPADKKLAQRAANIEVPNAQFCYGFTLLIEGKNKEGIEWIKKAASQKSTKALETLGNFAREGIDELGNDTEPNYKEAFEFFKKSAEKEDPFSMYTLAQFYLSGLAGEKNASKAKKLINKILQSSDELSYLRALIYETGTSVCKDLEKAKKYYESSIAQYHGEFSTKGLARVSEELSRNKEEQEKQALQTAEELLKEEAKASPSKALSKKTAFPKKSKKEQRHPIALSDDESTSNEPTTEAFDTGACPSSLQPKSSATDEEIKEMLNNRPHSDASFVDEINTKKGVVVIKNKYDDSTVTVMLDEQKALTPKDIAHLRKITYEDRVNTWFRERDDLLAKHTQETIDRHRFAQMVDDVVDLYGNQAIFSKDDGTLQENKVLPGFITTRDNRTLQGVFEYAFYKIRSKEKVLYHRFLHPHSKALPAVSPQ